jgi:hypothetical protein
MSEELTNEGPVEEKKGGFKFPTYSCSSSWWS